jgi:hypothetical protein
MPALIASIKVKATIVILFMKTPISLFSFSTVKLYYKREAEIAKANLFAGAHLTTTISFNWFNENNLYQKYDGCAGAYSGCQSCISVLGLLRMNLF